jgi:hypothetical protein
MANGSAPPVFWSARAASMYSVIALSSAGTRVKS